MVWSASRFSVVAGLMGDLISLCARPGNGNGVSVGTVADFGPDVLISSGGLTSENARSTNGRVRRPLPATKLSKPSCTAYVPLRPCVIKPFVTDIAILRLTPA